MKATLIRTSSSPVQASLVSGSPQTSFSSKEFRYVCSVLQQNKKSSSSPPPLPLEIKSDRTIRRAMSDSDVAFPLKKDSCRLSKLSGAGARSFPAKILEEDEVEDICYGDTDDYGRSWNYGKGKNSGGTVGSGGATGDSADQQKIGEYYRKMLKTNPGDPLLLRNYGQFLHQVEKDTIRAEEYYGRAILASQGDGEVLSLYGQLIWETQRNEDRARFYFEQAVQASPDDCFVMGSFARFLWEAEEDDGGEVGAAALVEAF